MSCPWEPSCHSPCTESGKGLSSFRRECRARPPCWRVRRCLEGRDTPARGRAPPRRGRGPRLLRKALRRSLWPRPCNALRARAGEWRVRCPSPPRRGAHCGLAAPDAGGRAARDRPAMRVNLSMRTRTVGRVAKQRLRTQERPDQVRLAPIHVRTTARALPGPSDAARDCRRTPPEVP